jgi:hypothetical protein
MLLGLILLLWRLGLILLLWWGLGLVLLLRWWILLLRWWILLWLGLGRRGCLILLRWWWRQGLKLLLGLRLGLRWRKGGKLLLGLRLGLWWREGRDLLFGLRLRLWRGRRLRFGKIGSLKSLRRHALPLNRTGWGSCTR